MILDPGCHIHGPLRILGRTIRLGQFSINHNITPLTCSVTAQVLESLENKAILQIIVDRPTKFRKATMRHILFGRRQEVA